MSPRPNIATSDMVAGNNTDANTAGTDSLAGADGGDSLSGADGNDTLSGGGDAYPMLSGAQEGALDRDGDGAPGGAPPGGNKPGVTNPATTAKAVVGEVVRKGAAPAAPTHNRKPNEIVQVRVTKAGHGQIHNGQGGTYDWNDETGLPYSVALAQENNKNVEIIG